MGGGGGGLSRGRGVWGRGVVTPGPHFAQLLPGPPHHQLWVGGGGPRGKPTQHQHQHQQFTFLSARAAALTTKSLTLILTPPSFTLLLICSRSTIRASTWGGVHSQGTGYTVRDSQGTGYTVRVHSGGEGVSKSMQERAGWQCCIKFALWTSLALALAL